MKVWLSIKIHKSKAGYFIHFWISEWECLQQPTSNCPELPHYSTLKCASHLVNVLLSPGSLLPLFLLSFWERWHRAWRGKMIKQCRGLQGGDSPASFITALRSLQAMRNRSSRPRFKQFFSHFELFIYFFHVYLLFFTFWDLIGYCIAWSPLLRQQCILNERLSYGFYNILIVILLLYNSWIN